MRFLLAFLALFLASATPAPLAQTPSPPAGSWEGEPIAPIPLDVGLDADRVALGEKLFHDPQLSRNNAFSCATCHRLSLGGGDGVSRPPTLTGGLHLRNIIARVPLHRLMIETDAPYLLPRDLVPKPKSRRNEPMHLPHILRAVAGAVGCEPDTLAQSTTETARRFFGLPNPG